MLKLTSGIIHDQYWFSGLLLTFKPCLLGVSWGDVGVYFPNGRCFSQNIDISRSKTIETIKILSAPPAHKKWKALTQKMSRSLVVNLFPIL